MPSFDVVSTIDWQEVDNAKNQALKVATQRFDFKNTDSEIKVDTGAKQITLATSRDEKIEALADIFKDRLISRGFSLMSFDFHTTESALGGSAKKSVQVQMGIDKDKAKQIVKAIKDEKFKAQVQIQGEQLRVSAKKRDDLQEIITFLKDRQDTLKLPLQFENFRD